MQRIKKLDSNQNKFVSTSSKSWRILYRSKIWKTPKAYDKTWSYDFPVYAGDLANCAAKKGVCPYIGYARTPCKRKLKVGDILTATFKIETTGNPVFNFKMEPGNTGNAPAAMRLLIQRKNDNWRSANNRFWYRTPFKLAATGPTHLMAELHPEFWTNVNGKTDAAGFANTLAKIGNVGFTFGGGSFFSHGVNVSGGTAKLVLLDFTVQ